MGFVDQEERVGCELLEHVEVGKEQCVVSNDQPVLIERLRNSGRVKDQFASADPELTLSRLRKVGEI